MAGMKRFVTYIYQYEDKKKGNNAGFAKVEVRGEECRIEVHLRGVYTRQGVCSVHLFRKEDEDMVGFLLGEMKLANGRGDFAVMTKAGKIAASSYGIYEMDGLCLISEDERMFASCWKEGVTPTVCREHFRIWEQPETGGGAAETEKAAARSQTSPSRQPQPEPTPHLPQNNSRETETVIPQRHPAPDETISATEIPMRNIFPKYDWLVIWEELKRQHQVFTPFEDKKICCVQMEVKDLRELPKRYWYLGNNSFLLHGFFNYRYIIIGSIEEERWFIGIPGIYQHQERVMAAIFGFPEFIPAAVAGECINEGEPINHFGYWYRFIEE